MNFLAAAAKSRFRTSARGFPEGTLEALEQDRVDATWLRLPYFVGKKGNSLRVSSSLGVRPYSVISKASAC